MRSICNLYHINKTASLATTNLDSHNYTAVYTLKHKSGGSSQRRNNFLYSPKTKKNNQYLIIFLGQ